MRFLAASCRSVRLARPRVLAGGLLLSACCFSPAQSGGEVPSGVQEAPADGVPERPIDTVPAAALDGVVTFGARAAGPLGLSQEESALAARFVDVTLLDASGRALASAQTDETGRFSFARQDGMAAVGVTARARHGAIDVATSPDARGQATYSEVVPIARVRAASGAIHFADTSGSMAGALHIVDTLLRGSAAVERWTGRALPPLFVYWGRGITVEWSFFRGEVPPGSGRYSLELLGGPLGEQSTTDTDEHDEGIVLHELGHFVMNRLAGDSSIGGSHPPGSLVDPGVAWEEGRATWFAMAVLAEQEPGREPWYRDTRGIVPTGSTRIDEDVEHPSEPRGLGSERSVAGILWDLTDGEAAGAVDRDADGVALGPARVLAAMSRASEEPGAFVALPGFLRSLVRAGDVSAPALSAMLASAGEDGALLATDDTSIWPVDLPLGLATAGRVDGLTDPSPSGAPARPDNGIDAVRVYRVHLERSGTLVLALDVEGTGTAADRTDLGLELWTRHAETMQRAEGRGAGRVLRRALDAGWYIAAVRDGGRGNRAAYRLTATLE